MLYYMFFDLIALAMILVMCFFAIINFSKILMILEIMVDFFIYSVQILWQQVIMKVNGGYGYVKKQRNFKRASAGNRRR